MRLFRHILIFTILIVFSLKTDAQIAKGIIKIRKTDPTIIGKTLSLFDLRTRECGTIFFEDDSYCQVKFIYEKEELKNMRVFFNSNENSKTFDCSYSLISDTSFVISWDDYSDTCYYKFVNEENNMVKFMNTPQGIFENNQFAFFYGFDSIVYSQSYIRSLSDFSFTDSVLAIDSVFKTIEDEEKKKKLTEELKSKVAEYKASISYNYFVGRYSLSKNKIELLNTNSQSFGILFLQKNNEYYNLFTHSVFEAKYPLISQYTHKVYGSVELQYDSVIIHYNDFKRYKKPEYQNHPISKDTYLVNHPHASNLYFYKGKDTLFLINDVMSETVKLQDVIGGYYPTYFQSLNGNKLTQSSLFFVGKKALDISTKKPKYTTKKWNYMIQNGVFYLYNNKDTLVDEMKNGLESFRFTYRNNQPYVFGAYQQKIKGTNNYEFILLFANNKGVKFTCSKNEYKYARESIENSGLEEKPGVIYEYFKYSATDDMLWLEYQNGKLEEMNFFNFNKAIRIKKGKKTTNYYLVN